MRLFEVKNLKLLGERGTAHSGIEEARVSPRHPTRASIRPPIWRSTPCSPPAAFKQIRALIKAVELVDNNTNYNYNN